MQVKTLYKTVRSDGGITVSPIKPENGEYTELFRLIADDGKAVTINGIDKYSCIDLDSVDGWYEVDGIEDERGVEGVKD